MTQITFYLDFISPYAYLAFEQLPRALLGLNYRVRYVPVLFAGLLKHHGQLGPAEIAPKREWTYRQVLWQAHQLGIDLTMPRSHPFNPLPLLRLALACSHGSAPGEANRFVCESIFKKAWCSGEEAAAPDQLAALAELLAPRDAVDSANVKAQLKLNTESAIAAGVFGVPTFVVDDKLFWGLDALPMLRAYLDDDAWFIGPAWAGAGRVEAGITRTN
jgi:2-hydroxychromene-2-carboxylate isomerase